MFPNPAGDFVNIEVPNGSIHQVKLIAASGRITHVYNAQGRTSIQLNISTLAKGVYFLLIETNVGWSTRKFVN